MCVKTAMQLFLVKNAIFMQNINSIHKETFRLTNLVITESISWFDLMTSGIDPGSFTLLGWTLPGGPCPHPPKPIQGAFFQTFLFLWSYFESLFLRWYCWLLFPERTFIYVWRQCTGMCVELGEATRPRLRHDAEPHMLSRYCYAFNFFSDALEGINFDLELE